MTVFDEITLTLFDIDTTHVQTVPGKNRTLLVAIDTFLQKQDTALANIEGIAVIVGEGSFTSTRIAVTVANTVAYARHIPVVAVTKEQSKDIPELMALFETTSAGTYISATYSGEPNIG